MVIEIRSIPEHLTIPLRHQVLWPDRSIDEVKLADDESAFHFGAYLNDQLVGVGSFSPQSDGAVRLRKLATYKRFQGTGVARKLVEFGLDQMKSNGFSIVWCDSRQTAVGFYSKLGFAVDDTIFQKNDLNYVTAWKEL